MLCSTTNSDATAAASVVENPPLRATADLLESPFYRLRVDSHTGGIALLVHRASDTELITPDQPRTLCQTIFFDGQEHTLDHVRIEPLRAGPVLASVRILGSTTGLDVSNTVTVYAELDRVDFDIRVHKPVSTTEQRLCQLLPLLGHEATLRIAAAGAVVRPRLQPEGDLLPGADSRRFAVQEYIDLAEEDRSVTMVPLDAFCLRTDLDTLAFESLGNDQNYREVSRDQNGVTEFRFRYSLQARRGTYDGSQSMRFAQAAATPLVAGWGSLPAPTQSVPVIAVDSSRAVSICLKPADSDTDRGTILRLREIAGQSGTLDVRLTGYRQVVQTDLLERDVKPLPLVEGRVQIPLPGHGYAALRLLP